MSSAIKYEDLCDLFSRRCKVCLGSRFTTQNGIDCVCSCQMRAAIKWRFEQIEIFPPSLKYKNWKDFTGIIGGDKITGSLTPESVKAAKDAALTYCFGSNDLRLVKNRRKNLIIHNHLRDGQNIVIAGNKHSGKTLLAALLLKEVAWSSVIHDKKLTFKWVKYSDIVSAAMWDKGRPVDYDYLDHLTTIHFLAIDDIDLVSSGHNQGHDHFATNTLFKERKTSLYPTIFVSSLEFLSKSRKDPKFITDKFGNGFADSVLDPKNIIIDLLVE